MKTMLIVGLLLIGKLSEGQESSSLYASAEKDAAAESFYIQVVASDTIGATVFQCVQLLNKNPNPGKMVGIMPPQVHDLISKDGYEFANASEFRMEAAHWNSYSPVTSYVIFSLTSTAKGTIVEQQFKGQIIKLRPENGFTAGFHFLRTKHLATKS